MSHTYEWVMSHIWNVWHDSFICVTSLHLWHMCGTTHSYMWHDSFVCVTWLIHTGTAGHGSRAIRETTECSRRASLDSFVCVTWIVHTGTAGYSARATRETPESSRRTSPPALVRITRMSHVTYTNESCRTCQWVMAHTWIHPPPRHLHEQTGFTYQFSVLIEMLTTTIGCLTCRLGPSWCASRKERTQSTLKSVKEPFWYKLLRY